MNENDKQERKIRRRAMLTETMTTHCAIMEMMDWSQDLEGEEFEQVKRSLVSDAQIYITQMKGALGIRSNSDQPDQIVLSWSYLVLLIDEARYLSNHLPPDLAVKVQAICEDMAYNLEWLKGEAALIKNRIGG